MKVHSRLCSWLFINNKTDKYNNYIHYSLQSIFTELYLSDRRPRPFLRTLDIESFGWTSSYSPDVLRVACFFGVSVIRFLSNMVKSSVILILLYDELPLRFVNDCMSWLENYFDWAFMVWLVSDSSDKFYFSTNSDIFKKLFNKLVIYCSLFLSLVLQKFLSHKGIRFIPCPSTSVPTSL